MNWKAGFFITSFWSHIVTIVSPPLADFQKFSPSYVQLLRLSNLGNQYGLVTMLSNQNMRLLALIIDLVRSFALFGVTISITKEDGMGVQHQLDTQYANISLLQPLGFFFIFTSKRVLPSSKFLDVTFGWKISALQARYFSWVRFSSRFFSNRFFT